MARIPSANARTVIYAITMMMMSMMMIKSYAGTEHLDARKKVMMIKNMCVRSEVIVADPRSRRGRSY